MFNSIAIDYLVHFWVTAIWIEKKNINMIFSKAFPCQIESSFVRLKLASAALFTFQKALSANPFSNFCCGEQVDLGFEIRQCINLFAALGPMRSLNPKTLWRWMTRGWYLCWQVKRNGMEIFQVVQPGWFLKTTGDLPKAYLIFSHTIKFEDCPIRSKNYAFNWKRWRGTWIKALFSWTYGWSTMQCVKCQNLSTPFCSIEIKFRRLKENFTPTSGSWFHLEQN